MKVLGIDPGTFNLGWGFIETNKKGEIISVDHGCLSVPAKTEFFERLLLLKEALAHVIGQCHPDVTVIEKIFLGKSVDSAFKLGHIRGICAVQCQAVGAQIVEYTPRTVKKQITGSGSAEKHVVQNFIQQQLPLIKKVETWDASDALALAFCHILQDSVGQKFKNLRG